MNEVEQIELSIEQAKDKVEKAEMLEILFKNPQFKKLMVDGYMKDYAVKMVNAKAGLAYQDATQQKYIDGQIAAIGGLNQYLQLLLQEGRVAKESIIADSEERDRILKGE